MATPIDFDAIEALARAILGQLSPLTGTRGTGTVTVTNPTGAAVQLDRNMFLLPVIGAGAPEGGAELADDLAFKVAGNPATALPYNKGGHWIIPAGGSLPVAIQSNLGGARHNLPAGTLFRFDPVPFELDPTATLVAAITDGADRSEGQLAVQRAVYYEELDAAQIQRDIAGGRLARLPGIMLVWTQSTPVEGRTATTNQGSTRLADGIRAFAENFRLFVISSSLAGDRRRRSEGLRIMQAATRLLNDQQVTTDGEQLTSMGSLEVQNRGRYARGEQHYIYQITLRVNRIYTREDTRAFMPWLRTHLQQALPGRAAPEPTTPLVVVDVGVPIPPGP
jgi:hypothetical protein